MAKRRREPKPQTDALPGDPEEAARARRRHPAERRTSRYSGMLLLIMLTQAAFGYSLLGPGMNVAWARDAHLGIGIAVLVLTVLLAAAVRALPWRGARERFLQILAPPTYALAGIQLIVGLMARGWLPGYTPELQTGHVGLGLLLMLLVTLLHVGAIYPSLLLSAKREHARALERARGGG